MPDHQYVYFDLDDTILDHRKAEKSALGDVRHRFSDHFEHIEPAHLKEAYHQGNVQLWHQYAHKEITKAELRVRRFAILFEALAITDLDPLHVSDYYMERYAAYWDYCQDARDVFFAVAERYPVGILTNGFAEIQHAKMKQFKEVRDILQSLVISEEVGVMKPHPELFAHAAEAAQTPPDQIMYIGDSYRSDVEGATQAGWDVIWYAPDVETAPDSIKHAKDWQAIGALLL